MGEQNPDDIQSKKENSKVLNFLSDHPWLATEASIKTIINIAQRQNDLKAVEAKLGRPLNNTQNVEVRDGVAILSINGPIFRYASWFHQISGGTSIQILAKDLNTALEDDEVESILLNIDSPGGQANGISEFASMLFEARKIKPIHAFVGGNAASAAYWIASAASKITISDTAILGSIGTVIQIQDTSVKDKKDGVRTFDLVSRKSPLKRVDATTEQGQEQILKTLDSMTDVFIGAVAKFRGVEVEKVEKDFGKGGVLVGQENVDNGLADELGSFEGILSELQNKINNEDLNMSETKTEKVELTIESVKKDFPLIAQALIKEGANAECLRIKGIEENSMAGHENLIQTLKFDGKTSPAECALQIIGAEKEKLKGAAANLEADADEIDDIEADGEVPGAAEKEDDVAVSNMVAGSNQ